MRVLLINTSEHVGGAAIAAVRLLSALNDNGVKAKMLVRDKQSDSLSVVNLSSSVQQKFNFVFERVQIFAANRFRSHRLFEVDNASCGTNITNLPEFKEADIIHLHWVNQGFLSLHNIQQIIDSGKPIVWTMHDMWPFTGICHHAGTCTKYLEHCGNCPKLFHEGHKRDLSYRTFLKKQALINSGNIHFVACSNWLANLARGSRLLKNSLVSRVSNAINTRMFTIEPGAEARQRLELPSGKRLLLFVANRVTDPFKGIEYLKQAADLLLKNHADVAQQMAIVVVGKDAELVKNDFGIEVFPQSYVDNERTMIDLYRASDLLVMPTLQDNLPNTIVETMACGKPCVGFNVGGLPEMISHKENGWLADYCNAQSLVDGILWCLDPDNYSTICVNARRTAEANYSEHAVAMQYAKIYNSMTHADKV